VSGSEAATDQDRDPSNHAEVAAPAGGILRIVVRGGGVPTPEQTAAVAAALMTAGGTDGHPADVAQLHDWQAATLREGVGVARIADRADLRRPHGPM